MGIASNNKLIIKIQHNQAEKLAEISSNLSYEDFIKNISEICGIPKQTPVFVYLVSNGQQSDMNVQLNNELYHYVKHTSSTDDVFFVLKCLTMDNFVHKKMKIEKIEPTKLETKVSDGFCCVDDELDTT